MKTIRIWDGCKVIALLTVSDGSYSISKSGGADNSGQADIELDPFAGLIVDHSTTNPPLFFRDTQE